MSPLLNRALVIVTACAAIWTASCKSSEESKPLPSGTIAEKQVTTSAVVKRVDYKTRVVTLERADGVLVTFIAGDQVTRLDEIKVGSTVTATYTEALAFEVKKAGQASVGTTVSAGVERADASQPPGATGQAVATITAKIVGIDTAAGTVTLQMPHGDNRTIKARNPANLQRVAVGDLVDITYKESIGLSITPAKP